MYFITAIISNGKFGLDRRTFGYATDYKTAEKWVLENQGNMQECLYDYILIEEIGPGIHPNARVVTWFRWEHPCWVMCEEPIEFNGTCNWAIG